MEINKLPKRLWLFVFFCKKSLRCSRSYLQCHQYLTFNFFLSHFSTFIIHTLKPPSATPCSYTTSSHHPHTPPSSISAPSPSPPQQPFQHNQPFLPVCAVNAYGKTRVTQRDETVYRVRYRYPIDGRARGKRRRAPGGNRRTYRTQHLHCHRYIAAVLKTDNTVSVVRCHHIPSGIPVK